MRYPLAEKTPRASTVDTPSASVSWVHVKTPPMLSGNAGVIVTLHSPAVEVNTAGPSGPGTVNDNVWSALVSARLTNDVPERRSTWVVGPCQVMSIGAGGGAHTAGVAIDANGTLIVRSPDTDRVAVPAFSPLAGPGDPVGLGEALGDDESLVGGAEMLGP
jgi:hypothetical protein